MQVSDYIRSKQTIAHSKCQQCGAPMWLARIEPDKPDRDKRTFECAKCQRVGVETVRYR
jgi:hypothetical protein